MAGRAVGPPPPHPRVPEGRTEGTPPPTRKGGSQGGGPNNPEGGASPPLGGANSDRGLLPALPLLPELETRTAN